MTQKPKFEIGQWVKKWTGDYTGPGVVRGISVFPNNKIQFLVGHTIEGGEGEFLHIYAAGNLLPIDDGDAPSAASSQPAPTSVEAVTTSPDGREGRKPVAHHELLAALVEAHRQVDSLLAQFIMMDDGFKPSKSPYWPEIERRAELIRKHGGWFI